MYNLNGLRRDSVVSRTKLKAEALYKDDREREVFMHGVESLYDLLIGKDSFDLNAVKIKSYREALGVSQRDMSKLLGIPDYKYYNIESGAQSDDEMTKAVENVFIENMKHRKFASVKAIAKSVSAFYNVRYDELLNRNLRHNSKALKAIVYILKEVLNVNDSMIAHAVNRRRTSFGKYIKDSNHLYYTDKEYQDKLKILIDIFIKHKR